MFWNNLANFTGNPELSEVTDFCFSDLAIPSQSNKHLQESFEENENQILNCKIKFKFWLLRKNSYTELAVGSSNYITW